MRFQRKLFDSRVARRIFGLFVLASFVPLLVLAAVLLNRVGSALESSAYEQLENAARGYGQVTVERLLSSAEWLRARGAANGTGSAPDASFGFDAVAALGAPAPAERSSWMPPAGVQLHDTLPTVVALPSDGRTSIAVAVRAGDGGYVGRVDPAYLGSGDALLGRGMEACAFSSTPGVGPVYCSTPLPAAAHTALDAARAQHPSGRLTWSTGDEEWLAAYWQLFLPSRFAAEPWTIIVSQPRSEALASLAIFNRVMPLSAIFTLALIVILAVTQVRRTLNPLNALVAATKRIAAQDFGTPVKIEHQDEFGTLGSALNGMAEQLEQQFGALRALGEIDRSILHTTAIEPVLETLFGRLEILVPGDHHAVLIVDSDHDGVGRIYRRRLHGSTNIERSKVSSELRAWLMSAAPDTVTDWATVSRLGLTLDRQRGDAVLHVVPMLSGEALAGALLIAPSTGTALAERDIASVRELAARVSVAISAGKREAELLRRAHFDALTNLPNRELLEDRLQQAVGQAQREEQSLAVLFIDLDGFKEVNDTLGHRSGDDLLKETALRLTTAVRATDTVARLSGDEYAIVLPHVDGALEAETVAVKAIEALRRPFVIDGRETYVSASIGLAMFPDDGATGAELLRKADMAMYNAKEAGKGRFRFFAHEMDRRLQERHSLHLDLRYALENGQFALAYQPQIDLRTGAVVAAEALLRWRHPRRGPISPALFVPILEETGLIAEVGRWVLRKALTDFATWHRARLPFARVAVNVSARQLLDAGFADMLAAELAAASLTGSQLEIELTEASLVQDFKTANDALLQLRSLGVRIALDDFGTGYSSLAYLNELVFDTLKIDRAFVVNLPAEKSVAIVKAIIAVASSLDKEAIAEGIESELQLAQLSQLGCHYGQGYLLGKPLASGELMASAVVRSRAIDSTTVQRRLLSTAAGR